MTAALILVACQTCELVAMYTHRGSANETLWYLSMGINQFLAWVIMALGIAWSLWKRPFFRRFRGIGFAAAVATLLPTYLITAYPSSHDGFPSRVSFRVPFDGPVTVGHGGATADVNYHVSAPDQRWAYDLFVSQNGNAHSGDGSKLTDYYYYGRTILAPADGNVRRVEDGHPDQPPNTMGGNPAGGNEVVIEVAPHEFLFLCHLQPHSIRVKPGQEVRQGDPIGLGGNSGNTSMPHLHIHLQDKLEDNTGEGIPLEFHHYRSGGKLVEHGIPHGGTNYEIIEHVP